VSPLLNYQRDLAKTMAVVCSLQWRTSHYPRSSEMILKFFFILFLIVAQYNVAKAKVVRAMCRLALFTHSHHPPHSHSPLTLSHIAVQRGQGEGRLGDVPSHFSLPFARASRRSGCAGELSDVHLVAIFMKCDLVLCSVMSPASRTSSTQQRLRL
jgi:hypothetical protein